MAEGVRCRLLRYLEDLTSEELKKFKLYLQDHAHGREIPWGPMKEAGSVEMAELLVSYQGEQEAWELALSIWENMGLRALWERARTKGPPGATEGPRQKDIQDERNNYQERMKEKLQFTRDRNSLPGEHESFQDRFTQLLLLQGYHYREQKQHELQVRGRKHAKVMEERGQFIEASALFEPDDKTAIQPRTVVLQGAAGIGKTTLARKVMLDWAEGKLDQEKFYLVFFLSCRELNQLGDRESSFADLIATDWPGPQAPMTEIMSQPEKLLFIIDGLDELKFPCNEHRYDLCKDWKEQRPVPILLSSLLRKTLLPDAYLLLTTRLSALGKFSPLLENACHVEILGFSMEHRKEYFCKFFRDEILAEKVFSAVEDNATLLTMCFVPLMNWIVCTSLKEQMERGQEPAQALKTTTALYMCYLSTLIPPDDKNFEPQHLRGLCCLAAEGIWERKLLFEEEDLRKHGLEAVNVSAFLDMNIFQKDGDCRTHFRFIHLSFQEFFAAMFYVMLSAKERVESPDSSIPDVKNLLEKCSEDGNSFVVLVICFLFGFLNAETAKELEKKFGYRMSPEIKSQLLQWLEEEIKREQIKPQPNFSEWYSYLYETQDAEFTAQALINIQEIKIDVGHRYDALISIFCVKHCQQARRIFFSYCGSSFDLPASVWQDLFSVVSMNENLRELTLYCHELGDSCLRILCEQLKHPDCKLARLMLENCQITYSNCQYLFSELSSNKSLKSLHLRYASFRDTGKKLPCETLGRNNWQLQTLRITCTNSCGTCFLDFFSVFVKNENLKNLDLSYTCLGENEMVLLCEACEKQDCQLQTLSLVFCELTPRCYQYLFPALSSNKSLKNLDLSENSFEETGIELLCKALENQNFKLEKLRLTDCKLTATCCQYLSSILMKNENLKDLDLSWNIFEEHAMTLLCEALKSQNCKLDTLRMSHCYLTAAYLQYLLLPVICTSESLKNLDLRNNCFGDEGMKLLCKTLKEKDCKLKTLSLWEYCLSEESENALTNLKLEKSFLIITGYEEVKATAAFFDWDAEDTI